MTRLANKPPEAETAGRSDAAVSGLLRGNKDIEASSSSVEYPMPTAEQMAAGDECEVRR